MVTLPGSTGATLSFSFRFCLNMDVLPNSPILGSQRVLLIYAAAKYFLLSLNSSGIFNWGSRFLI